MKPLSDFFPHILPHLPGCSEPLVAQVLLESAVYFCTMSETAVGTQPTLTATELDDALFDKWLEYVAAGAVARAMMVPSQPFSDPTRAQFFFARSYAGVALARRLALADASLGSLRVQSRPFF
jgi:hypothetical protein